MIKFSSLDWQDFIVMALVGILLAIMPQISRKIKRKRAKFRLNLKKRRKKEKEKEEKEYENR